MRAAKEQFLDVYLQPGELYLARQPAVIRTILGSCVGVTFWSARLHIGALCHSVLPRCPKTLAEQVSLEIGRRYVDFCVRDLARQFDRLGVRRSDVQVKLFGGADVLPVGKNLSKRPTVGRQNCETAIEVLHSEGFDVVASSLGGTLGRSIQFHTGTGEVLLRWLNGAGFEEVADDD